MSAAVAEVRVGTRVKLHLRLATTDGVEVENTFDDAPLELVIGDGTLAEGLEAMLVGLTAGARIQVELDAGSAFGNRQVALIHELPRADFPDDVEPGFIWSFTTSEGEELAGIVASVQGERVIVDFNHPLAGEPAVMNVEMLSVESP